jgi:hypothetical protein
VNHFLHPPNAQERKEQEIMKEEIQKIQITLTLEDEILMLQKELEDLNALRKK